MTDKTVFIEKKPPFSFLIQHGYRILGILFAIHVLLFWPGMEQPDSIGQYQSALSGVYGDHHPALMSFLWRYMDKIHPGFGTMFFLQILLQYVGLTLIFATLKDQPHIQKCPAWLLVLYIIPWWPQNFLYSYLIQKDTVFTFSFLSLCGILAWHTIKKQTLKWPSLLAVFALLVLGIGVKYQAQFCAIAPLLWLGFHQARRRPVFIRGLLSLFFALITYGTVNEINYHLVPDKQKSHSWQFVKLFDLAAISIASDLDFIPDYNKTATYDFGKIKERFQENAVDPYIYHESDNILQVTRDPSNEEDLQKRWRQAIWHHPWAYLKHRFVTFSYCLLGRVGFSHLDTVLGMVMTPGTTLYANVKAVVGALGYLFFSQLPIILLGLVHFILALRYFRQCPCAPIVVGFTSVSWIMMTILFFMSMAGTPRYTYVSLIMIHGSHLFAVPLYQMFWRQRKKTTVSI